MNPTTTPLQLSGDRRLSTAKCGATRWLEQVQLWRPSDPDQLRTGDHETAVLLLGGTFDLVGGSTAWPARGARQEPFGGRPMAVFLPKHTDFQVSNGSGELLLVAARQPVVRDEPTGRATLANKPLLPMAGSGKSFDPNSGEWRPAETFPTAPESLPPRRFERIAVGACTVERVLAPDYKAATLCIDEVVLAVGSSLAIADIPRRPAADEALLFVRTEGGATVDGQRLAAGDHALQLDRAAFESCRVQAITGRTYVVIAYAGKGA
jgi:hypothetical protein